MGGSTMVRTKSQIRASKSKGSQFEMDCAHSLKWIVPDIRRPGPEGFQMQYDLDSTYRTFECKCRRSITWNQAVKWFNKLKSVTPSGKKPYLLFKSNQQPCLVMSEVAGHIRVELFEREFGKFEKHPSTRAKK